MAAAEDFANSAEDTDTMGPLQKDALSVIRFANDSSPRGRAKSFVQLRRQGMKSCLSLWESNCLGDSLIRESEATTETVARRSRDGEGAFHLLQRPLFVVYGKWGKKELS